MNKIYLFLIIAAILIIAVAGYMAYLSGKPAEFSNTNQQTQTEQTQTQQTQNQQPTQPEAQNATISIENFSFNPETLNIKIGTTVTWTNNDTAPHQIGSNLFNSTIFGKGGTFTYTFNNVGEFDYDCPIHPLMKGKIIVSQ